jgi:two-component system heavy metal sensor histidine kinase CusS
MKRLPLRWRVALLTAALVGVVIAAVGFGVSWHLYREGIEFLDKDLHHVARGFFDAVDARHGNIDWSKPGVVSELLPGADRLYWVEIDSRKGGTLFRSRELGNTEFPQLSGRRAFGMGKIRGLPMRLGEFVGKGLVLKIAMNMRAVEETHDDLLRCYLVPAPLVLLVVAAGGLWIAGRALAPVEEIAASAERITAQRLDKRLPVPETSDELARLTIVLNRMIDGLEASFRQATRFTADASHELRTPLTVIRGELESALNRGKFEPAQEKLLINLLEETERLTHITEGLLLLSRADAGRLQLDALPFDLAVVIRDLIEDTEILAAPLEVHVEADVAMAAPVRGDAQFLRQLLFNLIDNATKYNNPGGRVRVTLERQGAAYLVRVGNSGDGIRPEQAAHVFDRFFRGDDSRSGPRRGYGLGLSICSEIARAHGGDISLDVSRAGWTEFRFCIPAYEGELPVKMREPAAVAG